MDPAIMPVNGQKLCGSFPKGPGLEPAGTVHKGAAKYRCPAQRTNSFPSGVLDLDWLSTPVHVVNLNGDVLTRCSNKSHRENVKYSNHVPLLELQNSRNILEKGQF